MDQSVVYAIAAIATLSLSFAVWRRAKWVGIRATSPRITRQTDRAVAMERMRARRLNVPDSAVSRHVEAYCRRGLSELAALRKMNDDLERDRGRWHR